MILIGYITVTNSLEKNTNMSMKKNPLCLGPRDSRMSVRKGKDNRKSILRAKKTSHKEKKAKKKCAFSWYHRLMKLTAQMICTVCITTTYRHVEPLPHSNRQPNRLN